MHFLNVGLRLKEINKSFLFCRLCRKYLDKKSSNNDFYFEYYYLVLWNVLLHYERFIKIYIISGIISKATYNDEITNSQI